MIEIIAIINSTGNEAASAQVVFSPICDNKLYTPASHTPSHSTTLCMKNEHVVAMWVSKSGNVISAVNGV